jgi:hypothetical protein
MGNNMCQDDVLSHRIEKVEEEVGSVGEDVKKIMTNHLPHLAEDIYKLDLKTTKQISDLQARLTIFGGLILTALGALIVLFVNS